MTITLLVGTVDHNVINSHYLPNEVRIDVLSLSFHLNSTSTGCVVPLFHRNPDKLCRQWRQKRQNARNKPA